MPIAKPVDAKVSMRKWWFMMKSAIAVQDSKLKLLQGGQAHNHDIGLLMDRRHPSESRYIQWVAQNSSESVSNFTS